MSIDAKRRTLAALRRYWPKGEVHIAALPVSNAPSSPSVRLPCCLEGVAVPDWAAEAAVDGQILVPIEALPPSASWSDVDWFQVAHWYLDGLAEREHERRHGPIHSYSVRLRDWDARIWERAWVNRIAMFLRLWAARNQGVTETALFGERPTAEIILTHDLDAVEKTVEIRIKQSAFHGFNALRELRRGKIMQAAVSIGAAAAFFVRTENYRQFDKLHDSRRRLPGVYRIINVYGGESGRRRSMKQWLFDPAYDVRTSNNVRDLRSLAEAGFAIGLHPSFDTWADIDGLLAQKQKVEAAVDRSITTCRQHWLRFSWAETWQSQETAGFDQDTTLGFNDRLGFRNGAAINFNPLRDVNSGDLLQLRSWPMVMMDSHLHDYERLDPAGQKAQINSCIGEICSVGGQATLLWHPHTLSADYGWREGFETLVGALTAVYDSTDTAKWPP